MNATNDVERELDRWMEDVVPRRAPDVLAPSILTRTRSIRPRPAWLARLMEPPMQTQLSLRRAITFGQSPRAILVALLILALVAAAIVVGSQRLFRPSLPAPFGLAANGLIAADVGGSVTLMRPDGSEMRRLDLPFPHVARMVFSRDGTRFAAWAADSASARQRSLFVANADGSAPVKLGDFSGTIQDNVSPLAWSPDDRRLAFTDYEDDMYVVDVANPSPRVVAPDASITTRQDPTWGPDGRLAYRCQTSDGLLHLCVTTPDLATERILPTSRGTDFAFSRSAWSHDGRQIAYQIDDSTDHPASVPGYDIATIDVATETERILTRGTVDHMILPVWTPDDRFILTIGGGIIATDGTAVRTVGEGRCGWTEPSPDGKFLICIGNERQVELWPIEGGSPTFIPLGGAAGIVAWQRVAD